MTSPTTDFGQRELVPAALTGVRRFNVDALGRLTGVTHEDVWRPGVNEGACKNNSGLTTLPSGYQYSSGGILTYPTSPNINILGPEVPLSLSHRVGSKHCTCGYYAFFDYDAENHGYQKGHVTAIIEGTGVATVGEKGFRCEKAEVVALVKSAPEPKPEAAKLEAAKPEAAKPGPEPKRRKRDALAWWLFESGNAGAGWLFYLTIFGAIAAFIGGITLTASPWFAPVAATPAFASFVIWSDFLACALKYPELETEEWRRKHGIPEERMRGFESAIHSLQSALQKMATTFTPTVPWDLIRRNYPDVPVYDTLDAALAEHPLSQRPPKPAVIAPDTVDDFWTRRADA